MSNAVSRSPSLKTRSRLAILFSAALLGFGLQTAGEAKAAEAPVSIGVVQIVDHEAHNDTVRGIVDGMADRGWKEGGKARFDLQNAHGDQSTLKNIGDRFVSEDSSLIFAVATPAVQSMARATRKIPIVGAAVTSYSAAKVVKTDDRPGGNVTGVSNIGPVAAQLDLLLKLNGGKKRVGSIYNAGEINSVVQMELLRKAAQERGVELIEATVTNPVDIQQAVQNLKGKVDGFVFPTDNVVVSGMAVILKTTVPAKLPTVAGDMGSVAAGCTAAMTVDYYKLGRQAAQMGADILEGKRVPAEMKIETQDVKQPTINVKAAKAIGLAVPQEVLAEAILFEGK